MKAKSISFFSSKDNNESKKKSKPRAAKLTGFVSGVGKLVFPDKTASQLGINPDTAQFKIGMLQGKRKIKSLFLVPAIDDSEDTFVMAKAAKAYTISMGVILQKGGIDFTQTKYTFTIKSFSQDNGPSGYELQLNDPAPKVPYTGKPRGRRPKAALAND